MIYGERIRLRRDERADLPKFVEWLNDPEVCRYLGAMNLPFSMVNEDQWFDAMLKLPREDNLLRLRSGTAKLDGWWAIAVPLTLTGRPAVQKWACSSVIDPAGTKGTGRR
jgi:hypothetical protein